MAKGPWIYHLPEVDPIRQMEVISKDWEKCNLIEDESNTSWSY